MRLSAPLFRLKREARLVSRNARLPLNHALDRIARREGFASWSALAAQVASRRPARDLLGQLDPGDLVLLGARPSHGKTLLALDLVLEAVRAGRPGYFFTLDYHEGDVARSCHAIGTDPRQVGPAFTLDTSDDICAAHIIAKLGDTPRSVAVVDYLQLLDQKRSTPPLADQIAALGRHAQASGAVIVVLSQIDRAFELARRAMPDLSDVRLPNPLDLHTFSKACFLHEGAITLTATHS